MSTHSTIRLLHPAITRPLKEDNVTSQASIMIRTHVACICSRMKPPQQSLSVTTASVPRFAVHRTVVFSCLLPLPLHSHFCFSRFRELVAYIVSLICLSLSARTPCIPGSFPESSSRPLFSQHLDLFVVNSHWQAHPQ